MTSNQIRQWIDMFESDDISDEEVERMNQEYDITKEIERRSRQCIEDAGFEIEDAVQAPVLYENGIVEANIYVPSNGFTTRKLHKLNSMPVVDGEVYISVGIKNTIQIQFNYKS